MSHSSSTPRISLRQIAESLGISHSTVSLALRGHPRIPAPLRQRIHETAALMGYRPDPALTALAHYRKGRRAAPVQAVVAWMNSWEQPERLRETAEFDAYWRGAEEAAQRLGYELEEFVAGGARMPAARLATILRTRNVRGILIPPHRLPPPDWKNFPWGSFSVVRFGRSVPHPASHLVTSDHVTNTLLAFRAMRERGYRRIGFVTGTESERGIHYIAGFELARAEAAKGCALPTLTLQEQFSAGRKSRLLKKWIERNEPDAILTDIREVAELLDGLRVRVPEEMGLAWESVVGGALEAGINQRSEEVGRVAMRFLVSMINDNEIGLPEAALQIVVHGQWIDGPTLPRRS